ncbi:MAG: glycosyltransferase family 2 protein [Nitrospinota bacterium]
MDKIVIIIPAYNEAENIAYVINDISRNYKEADILVVNDGSTDATAKVAEELGVNVITLPFNLGIGSAMQTGYMYAEREGFDIAVQFDGDGQHRADQIDILIKPIIENTSDIVIGSRFIGENTYNLTLPRLVGSRIFSKVVSFLVGKKLTDTTSGFRTVNREVIKFFNDNYPEDYPEVEALVLLHKAKFRIGEVPVRMEERLKGKSSITPFQAFYYMVKVLLATLIDIIKRIERR